MPCEIVKHAYLYTNLDWFFDEDNQPRQPQISKFNHVEPPFKSLDELRQRLNLDALAKVAVSLPEYRDKFFRYNPIHDMEALWWVAATALFGSTYSLHRSKEDSTSLDRWGNTASTRQTRHLQLVYDLFADNSSDSRLRIFESQDELTERAKCLPPSVYDAGCQLDTLRQGLVEVYHRAEKNAKVIPLDAVGTFYTTFGNTLLGLYDRFKRGADVQIGRFSINSVFVQSE